MARPQGPSTGAATVFRRIGTQGWLVLAGSIPDLTEGDGWLDRLVARVNLARSVVWLAMDPDDAEPTELLDDLEDTLLTSIAIASLSDPGWDDAGLLLLGGSPAGAPWVNAGVRLRACLDLGGVVMAMGVSAAAFGEVTVSTGSGSIEPGLNWVTGGLILAQQDDVELRPPVRAWLQSSERRYALKLPQGSVFALGPDAEAEVWGGPPPGVVLGSGWTHS